MKITDRSLWVPFFLFILVGMKLLMVCLGNICRSPLAEGVMRKKIKDNELHAEVDSAGTSNYHTGEYPDPRATACAKNHGINISKLKARQFTVKDFDNFDHIFVMDTSNLFDVNSLARNAADKKKVELIMNAMYPDSNISVPDPYYGGDEGFEKVVIMLDNACESIALGISLNERKR